MIRYKEQSAFDCNKDIPYSLLSLTYQFIFTLKYTPWRDGVLNWKNKKTDKKTNAFHKLCSLNVLKGSSKIVKTL